jgi:hypothetical protein
MQIADRLHDDQSITSDDRLLRAFAHNWYSPSLGVDESPYQMSLEELTQRLSSQGFQDLSDEICGVRGMSAYVERLLGGSAKDFLDWWSSLKAEGGPFSLIMLSADSVRAGPPDGPNLRIQMDIVHDGPFEQAHANVLIKEPGGGKITKGTQNKLRGAARVILP